MSEDAVGIKTIKKNGSWYNIQTAGTEFERVETHFRSESSAVKEAREKAKDKKLLYLNLETEEDYR